MICWASWISQVQSSGLLSVSLRSTALQCCSVSRKCFLNNLIFLKNEVYFSPWKFELARLYRFVILMWSLPYPLGLLLPHFHDILEYKTNPQCLFQIHSVRRFTRRLVNHPMLRELKDYQNSLAGQHVRSKDGSKIAVSNQSPLLWGRLQRAGREKLA